MAEMQFQTNMFWGGFFFFTKGGYSFRRFNCNKGLITDCCCSYKENMYANIDHSFRNKKLFGYGWSKIPRDIREMYSRLLIRKSTLGHLTKMLSVCYTTPVLSVGIHNQAGSLFSVWGVLWLLSITNGIKRMRKLLLINPTSQRTNVSVDWCSHIKIQIPHIKHAVTSAPNCWCHCFCFYYWFVKTDTFYRVLKSVVTNLYWYNMPIHLGSSLVFDLNIRLRSADI